VALETVIEMAGSLEPSLAESAVVPFGKLVSEPACQLARPIIPPQP
jgi:hypothetical protein